MALPPPPFEGAPDGVRVFVRVTPKASPAGIAGAGLDAAGRAYLKVRVGAAAEGGKANAELLRLLAKAWGLAPSRLEVAAGARARRKTVHVAGDPPALLDHLHAWFGGRHE